MRKEFVLSATIVSTLHLDVESTDEQVEAAVETATMESLDAAGRRVRELNHYVVGKSALSVNVCSLPTVHSDKMRLLVTVLVQVQHL